jgi:Bacterial Ig-like domain
LAIRKEFRHAGIFRAKERVVNLHRSESRTAVFVGLVLCSILCLVAISDFVRASRRRPLVESTSPSQNELGVSINSPITLTLNNRMRTETIGSSTFELRDDDNRIVPARVEYRKATRSIVLSSLAALQAGHTYEARVSGGARGIKDSFGHSLADDVLWRFTTGVSAPEDPAVGPGGPILLITSAQNHFSEYYAEILRNEGFNEFAVADISNVSIASLQKYDIALAGEIPLSEPQIRMLSDWVKGGGNLIAMRPDSRMVKAFGLGLIGTAPGDSQMEGAYLAINGKSMAGAGLVHEPMQIHGPADMYFRCAGTSLATLYKDAKTATAFSAVCGTKFGRGNVVVFGYDLARSVVYTRQGNPLWSGHERDGITPIRSDDLFFGAAASDPRPDWVDSEKIAIPQADVQQRLLANILTLTNADKMPLPRFWYLPYGFKAAIVMTGDDHGLGRTDTRFKGYLEKSVPGCSVDKWECIRATSNVFVGSIPAYKARGFVRQGFEIALHVYTGCKDWPVDFTRGPDGVAISHLSRGSANALYDRQLEAFATKYQGVPPPVSSRIDCVTWGDYDTQPQVELAHGIRFDTNYYYWPEKWVRNRPGMFTGSGMPMRFAKLDGRMVDVYQAATQMTDESKQTYPYTIDTLLTNATGKAEYYGVFTANMHNDRLQSPGADAIVAAAQSFHVPVVSAAQMLKWLDGRNSSSFQKMRWSEGRLEFTTAVGTGGNGIQVLLPMNCGAGELVSLKIEGRELERHIRTVTGLTYAAFAAAPGVFVARYEHPRAKSGTDSR